MSKLELTHDRIANLARGKVAQCGSETVPEFRKIRRTISKELSSSEARVVLAVSKTLLGCTEVPKWFPYEIIHYHDEAMQSLKLATLRQLAKGLSAWGEVDAFACYLSGPAWRENQITNDAVQRWAKSKERWWRRTAAVSTVALNNAARGGTVDVQRTLDICELLLDDRDDMVVKGLSWTLRELAKKAPSDVREFMNCHDDVMAARIMREVRNKLDRGLKTPRNKTSCR